MATPLSTELDARIQTFVADLTALVRRAALESVSQALGTGSVAPQAPARAARSTVGRKRTSAPSATKLRLAPRKKGAKRDPNEIATITDAVRAHVSEHPGEGVEAIATHLRVPTAAITLPIAKLLRGGEIRKKGLKRATRYFPR